MLSFRQSPEQGQEQSVRKEKMLKGRGCMEKQRKNIKNCLTGVLIVILLVTAVAGCGSVDSSVDAGVKQGELSVTPAVSEEGKEASTEENTGTIETGGTEDNTSKDNTTEQSRFELYLSLLSQMQEDINQTLGEKPEKTEEEAFDYKKAGIRIWFERGEASQIWTSDRTVDFGGAHVGDDIGKFKETFGEPSQDVNGEAHFGYDGHFLVVQYDTASGETAGVYLLAEDYGYDDDIGVK